MKFRILHDGRKYVPQIADITISCCYNGKDIEQEYWEDIEPYYYFETEEEARMACEKYATDPRAAYEVVAEFEMED